MTRSQAQGTLRSAHHASVDYFKAIAEETGVRYQAPINLDLRD